MKENHYKYYTNPKNPKNTIYGIDDEKRAFEYLKEIFPGNVFRTLAKEEIGKLILENRSDELPDIEKYNQKFHQDFIAIRDSDKKEWQFEFKSVKHFKTERGEDFVDEDYNTICLEFVNDSKHNGWIYSWEMKNKNGELVNDNHWMMFLVKNNGKRAYLMVKTEELYASFYPIYCYIIENEQHNSFLRYNPKKRYKVFSRKYYYPPYGFNCRLMWVSLKDIVKHCKSAKFKYIDK